MTKQVLDPAVLDTQAIYRIMAGCIVPRPIGLISSTDRAGIFNAAPFSFFNMVSHDPPLVSVSIARNRAGDGPKDTLANILATKDFVVNIVNEDIVAAADRCSDYQPPEVDEIALAGLTAAPSVHVAAPYIAESPVNFECRLANYIELPGSLHSLVIGRIVGIQIAAGILLPNGRIDHRSLATVGRLAGNAYCRTRDMFALAHDGFAAVAAHGSTSTS